MKNKPLKNNPLNDLNWFDRIIANWDRQHTINAVLGFALLGFVLLSVDQCSEKKRAREERRQETNKRLDQQAVLDSLKNEYRSLESVKKNLAESVDTLSAYLYDCYENNYELEQGKTVVVKQPVPVKTVGGRRPASTPVTKPVARPAAKPMQETATPSANVVFKDNATYSGTVNVNNGTINNYNGTGGVIRIHVERTRVYKAR